MRNILLMIVLAHGVCGASDLSYQLVKLENELIQLRDLLNTTIQDVPEPEVDNAIAEAQKTLQEIFSSDFIMGTKKNLTDALDDLNDRISYQPGYGFDKLLQQYRNPQLKAAVIKKLPELDNFMQEALEDTKNEIASKIQQEEIPQRETLSEFYSIGAYLTLRNKLFPDTLADMKNYEALESRLTDFLARVQQKRAEEREQVSKTEEEKIINAIQNLPENISLENIDAFLIPLPSKLILSGQSWGLFNEIAFYHAVGELYNQINRLEDKISKTPDVKEQYEQELVLAIICWYISDFESPFALEEVNDKSQYQKLINLYIEGINSTYRNLIGKLDLKTGKIPNELKNMMRKLAQNVKNLSSREEVMIQLDLLKQLENMLSSRRINIVLKDDEDFENFRQALVNRYSETEFKSIL